jgi:aspartate dehydrogenase
MGKKIRVGLIGCGVIGGFVLDAFLGGKIDEAKLVVICQRSERPAEKNKALAHGIRWVTKAEELLKEKLDVVVEAASHQALEEYGVKILNAGMDLIPVSIGALVDARLLGRLIDAAAGGGSRLHLPSGGIGGLDAIQGLVLQEVEEISMTTRKPPNAWKGIPYVEKLGLDMDKVTVPTLLYEGPARDCVKKFPQSINIAAALSLAGIGFEKTKIRILADPGITHNTHEIQYRGEAGRLTMKFENVPVPANPKTSYLACLSVLAALKNIRSPYRVGT